MFACKVFLLSLAEVLLPMLLLTCVLELHVFAIVVLKITETSGTVET